MIMVEWGYRGMDTTYKSVSLPPEIATWWHSNRLHQYLCFFKPFLFFDKIGEGMDTAYKSVTFAAEIGTWLDSNTLDLYWCS